MPTNRDSDPKEPVEEEKLLVNTQMKPPYKSSDKMD